MTKVEYIEKYGEEAWEERLKKVREWNKKNKDYVSQKKKEYYKENKTDILSKRKQYYSDNKTDILDIRKDYYNCNKEKILISKKVYRQENKETISAHNKEKYNREKEKVRSHMAEYRSTRQGRAVNLCNSYKNRDLIHNYDISQNIDSKWIIDNIFSGQSCIYCGESDWTRLGCDRIDNSKPHTPDNVVCACGLCNIEKQDGFTVEEFRQYRALHPRACDIPKAPALQLSETGALKKRTVL